MALISLSRPRLFLAGALLMAGGVLAACGDTAAPTAGTSTGGTAATATTVPGASDVPTATTAAAGGGAAAGSPIAVTLNEWSIDPKAISVPAGHVSFKVTNKGKFKHNFAFTVNGQQVKSPNIATGETTTVEADVTAGSYPTLCTIPGHKDQGMAGTLDVK